LVADVANAGSCKDFGAIDAGKVGDVAGGIVQADSPSGRVGNGILLSVNSPLLMSVANARDVRCTREVTIVSGGYNALRL
jgi:hypothetical protein